METDAIYHIAKHFGYDVETICVAISNRSAGTFLADSKQAQSDADRVALDTLASLYHREQ